MESENRKKNEVFFFEDYSAKDVSEKNVGRKGLSLFELKDMDVPVPEFFVLSSSVFVDFCFSSLKANQKKLLSKGRNPEVDEIEGSFLKENFSEQVEEEILSAYTRLSGFTDAWVSVRSSVVFPENEKVSFSGIFSTELNVRKFDDLKKAIKRIYASMFTDDVVAYASRMGIDLADVKIAVVVQKMVQSEISGVVFTVDPITQDNKRLSVEAVYGLGDVISLGEITPDSYLLNKKDLSIVEKHISPQEWMKVRTMKKNSRGNIEKIKISSNWSHRQKLFDKDMEEISKIALIVESKSRKIQSLEWVLSGGRFWVLQNKPLYEKSQDMADVSVLTPDAVRKNLRELVLGFVEKYKGENMIVTQAVSDAQRMMKRNSNEAARKLEKLILSAKKESEKESVETKKEDFVVSGIGASFGVATGKITVVDSHVDKKFGKQDILLIKKFSSEMESMIVNVGGVIMDTGGLTSDTAILCRELEVPAVVGATKASQVLKSGDWVQIDGNSGVVYMAEKKEKKEEVHPVVEAYSQGDVSGVDLLKTEGKDEEKEKDEKEKEEESRPTPPVDTTLQPSATKVFATMSVEPKKMFDYIGNSHGIVYVDLDKILIEDGRHILAYVEDKKFVDFSKKICDQILEYIELVSGNEVVVSLGSSRVKDFKSLTKGKSFEDSSLSDDVYGGNHYVNNPELLKRAIKIVRRLRNVYRKRNVSIALHSPMGSEVMKEFKKQLSGQKLRRSSTFNVYAIIDNPSEVILADEIVGTKIDGLILNMPRIARQMQGFKVDQKDAKYDLSRNSVFKVLDNIIDVVRGQTERIIVVVEDSKPLLRYCVQTGVYGVSVFPEDIVEARKVVSEEETKLILGN